ncbi:hypothetical protein [Rhodococcus wratislaviensis]|uniref:hypothetical protein n=1 Tax=Rhodococcus wratislaviensis TaxID=44752 RepID=UPI003662423A
MSTFDDAVAGHRESKRIAEEHERRTQEKATVAAQSAAVATRAALKDFVAFLGRSGVQPRKFQLPGHKWYRPEQTPPGFLLAELSTLVVAVYVDDVQIVTPDGRLWRWDARFGAAKRGFVEISARSILDEKVYINRHVCPGSDGVVIAPVHHELDAELLTEFLARRAVQIVEEERRRS